MSQKTTDRIEKSVLLRSLRAYVDAAAPVFAALGDATRLGLVSRLAETGPMSITKLASGTSMTRQGVTKHLRILGKAGVMRDARRGRERIWEIDVVHLRIAEQFLEHASARWDAVLDRLKAFVEREPPP
jgi:DNA-binding transcriptional ArsR family regulator